MRTRRSVFFISALCSLFISSAVFAQERGQRRGQGKMEQLAQRLGLDAEQMRQFEAIQSQQRQVIRPLKREIRAKRQQMQKLWQTDSPDRGAILAKHAEMDHVRNQLRSIRLDARLAMHAMLSPEQRQAMGRAGRAQAITNGWQVMGQRVTELYARILRSRKLAAAS